MVSRLGVVLADWVWSWLAGCGPGFYWGTIDDDDNDFDE